MKIENPEFWMVYVPGSGRPKKRHESFESAVEEANRLRSLGKTADIFVLQPVFKLEGRKILSVKKGCHVKSVKVEPEAR